jgi:type IV pilus assembly protein PilA
VNFPKLYAAAAAPKSAGFTLIEMMAVLAILAILAMLAIPSYYFRVVRQQIDGMAPLVSVAEAPVAAAWAATQTLPVDNAGAGIPAADKMVNNYVSAVMIANGAVNVTFGNRATAALAGKVLTIRPAVVSDSPQVPVTWVCGNATAPHNMTLMGVNQTTIPPAYLPLECK